MFACLNTDLKLAGGLGKDVGTFISTSVTPVLKFCIKSANENEEKEDGADIKI